MTEQESPVNHRWLRGRRRSQWIDAQPPAWPGDSEHMEAGKIDFEAIAHVLANTCRWGGCTRRLLSLGDEDGEHPALARAAARARVHGSAIDTAVRESAGLDLELPQEWSEALRFVARMTESAERRDLGVGAGGFPFPPLRRTIRPLVPEAAAERWLARPRELAGSRPADTGSVHAVSSAADTAPASVAAEASS